MPDEASSAALQINDVQPAEALPSRVIVIKGQGFAQDATVTLGGAALQDIVISSDGSTAAGIIPQQPADAATVDVTVVNPNGQTASLQNKFTFDKPQVKGISAPR